MYFEQAFCTENDLSLPFNKQLYAYVFKVPLYIP